MKGTFSSFECIGGAQMQIPSNYFGFAVDEPKLRTCLFENVCLISQRLIYYENSHLSKAVPKEYLLEGFDEKITHIGVSRDFTFPIHVEHSALPAHLSFDDAPLVFLEANSNNYNYGHYIFDNVFPHFVAAKIFGFAFNSSRQLFEGSCDYFGTHYVPNILVPFNYSIGTIRA
jgi:hypothetical protein